MNLDSHTKASVLVSLIMMLLWGLGCTAGAGGTPGDDSTPVTAPSDGGNPGDGPGTPQGPGTPAGITVNPTAGLSTTEAGATAQLTVVLNRAPTADVTIPISSDDLTEGTVSVASLTFTPSNWRTPQTVTATGVDDLLDDGDVPYTIVTGAAASADVDYNGLDAADAAVTNADDDTAGITVTPTSGLVTTEAGATAQFTVVLNSQPTADVTIAISTSDATEATPSPTSLTFTPADWDVHQVVTLTGVDDPDEDADVALTIVTGPAVSADAGYDGLNASDVSVTNRDDELMTVVIEPDDFAEGTELTHVSAHVTLSTTLDDNVPVVTFPVTANEDGFRFAPTGDKVFGHANVQFFNDDRRLRMDFTVPARAVQIQFAGGTYFDTEIGRLRVYDQSGTLLAEAVTGPMGAGVSELLSITRSSADIAWAVAYVAANEGSFGRFDALSFTIPSP